MSEFGLKFSIGARLSSSVASSFASLDARMRRTQQTMNSLANTSKAMRNALDLRAQRDDLRERYVASGRTDGKLLAELKKVSRAYHTAKTKAIGYGAAVEQWRERQAAASAELERTRTRMERLRGIQAERGNRKEIYGSLLETVAPATGVAMPVKLAIDFESSMADAAKTMDGMRDAGGKLTPKYYEMQNIIKGMGRELPLAHEEIARLFAAGGQLGMSDVGELKEFATMSAHMSVAFGMSSEEAADAIGGFRTALKMNLSEVRSTLDLMNQFANTTSSTEKGIAEIVSRIGPLGNVAGVSAKPLTALAATLDSMKISPEIAATAIKNMMLSMVAGTEATKGQRAAYAKLGIDVEKLARDMQRDGPAAILAVLEAVQRLEKHEQTSIMQEIFGKESLGAIAPLLGNLELTRKNLRLAADESAYAGAMQQEFENRSRTTANALQLAKNRMVELGINLGSVLLPPLNQLLALAGPVISAFADWAAANPTVVTSLMGVVGGLVAVKVGMLAARLAVSGGRSAFLTAAAPVQLLHGGFQALRRSMDGTGRSALRAGTSSLAGAGQLSAAGAAAGASGRGWRLLAGGIRGIGGAFRMALGPVGWAITAAELLIANWDTVAPFFTGMWEKVRAIFNAGLSYIQPIIDTIGKGLSLVGEAWDWAFGDEEKERVREKINVTPLGEKAVASGMPTASAAGIPAVPLPSPSPSAAAGPTVSVGLNVTLQGVPETSFAEGVMRALRARSGDVERLISDIVHNQARLAYGG